ncbi:hypothetical protein ACP4OV_004181 [Aristida adscensionis]
MSPFISTSIASQTSCSCLAMSSSSSLLAPKGQLKLTTAFLLILFSVFLFASPCESRVLRVINGKGGSSKSPLPGKQDVASLKADCHTERKALSNVDSAIDVRMAHVDAKVKEGVAMAISSPVGAVKATPVHTVSQRRLSQREDTGFHIDYAGPRTHTPSHN